MGQTTSSAEVKTDLKNPLTFVSYAATWPLWLTHSNSNPGGYTPDVISNAKLGMAAGVIAAYYVTNETLPWTAVMNGDYMNFAKGYAVAGVVTNVVLLAK